MPMSTTLSPVARLQTRAKVASDDVGVVALDDYTVEFTLNYGAGFFGQIASMWINRPMPQWDIEEYGDVWTEPGNMSTNGPFVMTSGSIRTACTWSAIRSGMVGKRGRRGRQHRRA